MHLLKLGEFKNSTASFPIEWHLREESRKAVEAEIEKEQLQRQTAELRKDERYKHLFEPQVNSYTGL